jgi:hypothetical protein
MDTEPELLTPGHYRERLQALYNASEQVARRRDWCHTWFNTFNRLTPHISATYHPDTDREEIIITFPGDGIDPSWVSPAKLTEYSTEYHAELDRIRGRILSLVQGHTIAMQDANNVLAALRFPAYTPEGTINTYRATFRITLALNSPHPVITADREFREALIRFATEHGVTNPQDLSNRRLVEITDMGTRHPGIRAQDIIPLLDRQ